jgi:hypothetical protein
MIQAAFIIGAIKVSVACPVDRIWLWFHEGLPPFSCYFSFIGRFGKKLKGVEHDWTL